MSTTFAQWSCLLALAGCSSTGAPTPQAQATINVLCATDMMTQPVVVPVIAMASPAAGAAQPGVAAAVAVDTMLVHPAVVAACAQYGSKPGQVITAAPAAATVAPQIVVTVSAVAPSAQPR